MAAKKRRLWRWLRRGLVVYAGLLAALILVYGQHDQAQPADVIIVLGAGLPADNQPGPALVRRAAHAADLWAQGLAPAILCTGGLPGRATRTEADACAELLRDRGVPAAAIVEEGRSRSTEENALEARAVMQRYGWQTAVLVTDAFHLFRANWIFQSRGLHVFPSPAGETPPNILELAVSVLRELAAFHWQILKDFLSLPVTYVKFF